jgi:Cu2+-exporting ATPase
MKDLGWSITPALDERGQALEASGHTVIYIGWAGRVPAVLSLDDTPLPEARWSIEELRGLGLHVTLLTGDLEQTARRVGVVVGIEDIQATLSPEEKRAALARLRQSHQVVAMIGDGLNDGPVLADADVGIAVGSGTDLARETASLVLPAGGLWMLPWVISVARAVHTTILTNLIWAFGYNLVALTLAVLGLLQPVFAAVIMASSSLLLVANSLRLSRLPGPSLASSPERPANAEPDDTRRALGALIGGPAIQRS